MDDGVQTVQSMFVDRGGTIVGLVETVVIAVVVRGPGWSHQIVVGKDLDGEKKGLEGFLRHGGVISC